MSYKSLREECYYKTGRTGVVLEAIDQVQPNLFCDNKNVTNNIFSNSSKFRFTLIDSRKTQEKGKALYYNLDPGEAILLTYLLSDGISSSFIKRASAFNSMSGIEQNYLKEILGTFDAIDFGRFDRMMDYTKEARNTPVTLQKNIHTGSERLLVRKMMISFEEAMTSSSKWKLTIEVGEAVRDPKGNGLNVIKPGSYKTLDKSFLLLQANEIVTPVSEAAKRVILSQGIYYVKMKAAELDFTRRKIENKDYEGAKIDEWNPQGKTPEWKEQPAPPVTPKSEPKKQEQQTQTAPTQSGVKELNCSDCGVKIDQKVYDYSSKVLKRPLCFNCQKKNK